MMNLAELQSRILEALALRARELELDSGRIRADYVLNWGGFVNWSFQITDGHRNYHLKLTHEPEQLQRWREVHRLLEERYRAPVMVDWITIPGTEFEGALFAFIPGTVPEELSGPLREEVLSLIQRLHQDDELARYLNPDGVPALCLETYLEKFHHRFVEDLNFIAASPPEFVSAEILAWLSSEVAHLENQVRSLAAFSEPTDSPIHSDLWLNNLLVADDSWYLLDWDDLALGDPAVDYATLLGPSRGNLRPLQLHELPQSFTPKASLRERLELYARATLLDWIIDPLADYLDADAAPEHAEEVRAEKERVHREALALYRRLYA